MPRQGAPTMDISHSLIIEQVRSEANDAINALRGSIPSGFRASIIVPVQLDVGSDFADYPDQVKLIDLSIPLFANWVGMLRLFNESDAYRIEYFDSRVELTDEEKERYDDFSPDLVMRCHDSFGDIYYRFEDKHCSSVLCRTPPMAIPAYCSRLREAYEAHLENELREKAESDPSFATHGPIGAPSL